MTRIVVIGSGAGDIAAQLNALGLSAITTRQEFQSFASVLADPDLNMRLNAIVTAHMQRAGVPAYGGDRAYLKKKKGRS